MTTPVLELAAQPAPLASAVPDFDRLARVYRWMEWLTFGPFLQRCRCAWLSSLTGRRCALILGDGDGRFTSRLLQTSPAIRVDAVDASPAMLNQLAKRSPAGHTHTHIADARAFVPPRNDYDLFATHFFLDCLTQPEVTGLASRLRRHASPGATWIVSDFAIPPNLYGRAFAAPLIRALYLAFRLLTRLQVRTLPDHHAALSQSGWSLRSEKKLLGGLLISQAWILDPESSRPSIP